MGNCKEKVGLLKILELVAESGREGSKCIRTGSGVGP